MKQINFKIEKNATEAKAYIEFNSLIEFMKEYSINLMNNYLEMNDAENNEEDEEMKKKFAKFADEYLESSITTDKIQHEIRRQFYNFEHKEKMNGFS